MSPTDPSGSRGRTRAWAFRVAASLAAVALVVGGAFLLGLIDGVGGPARLVWLARNTIFGPEPVGIWKTDPRLGWRHVPGAVGRQRLVPDYDVQYRIDDEGNREIPGSSSPGTPAILFFGGSFTFGHGVEDGEPFPALLQRQWPHLRIVNAATNGWGTTQALLALDEHLDREAVVGVVYGFISHHVRRNHRGREWLEVLDEIAGRRNPYFELDAGALVFRGLAGPESGVEPGPEQTRRELDLTVALVRELGRRCAARGIPFVFVNLPDTSDGSLAFQLLAAAGVSQPIDLHRAVPYAELHFEHDAHLHPEGHRRLAAELAPLLAARLALSPGPAPTR